MQYQGIRGVRLAPMALAVMGTFAFTGASAEEELSMAPVVVSERAEPESTAVITSQDMQARAVRDVREIFENTPGVTVGGGANPIAQKIYVRGIEDTMLNTTIDGAPQGGWIFHHQSRVMVNPELLKQVELDKGSAPASAGPGALAGSLRLTTKDAGDLLLPGQNFGGIVRGGLSSNDGDRFGGTVFGRVGEDFDFLLSGDRVNTDDYKAGNGVTQVNSGSTQKSGLAKFNWRVAPGHAFYLGYQLMEDEGVRYLRPNMWGLGVVRNGPPMPQKLERGTLTAGYRFAGEGNIPAIDLNVFSDSLKYQRKTPTAQANFNKPAGYTWGEEVDGTGVNLLLTSKVADATLRYGANHHRYDMQVINSRPRDPRSNGQEDSQVTGLFVEGSVPLASQFVLGAGARYDWYNYNDNHKQNFSSNGLSPNASLTWLATDTLSFRASASRTLRGAGLKESFYVDNTTWKNDPGLDPEWATNYDLGFNYETGPWYLKGSVFRLTIDDYITTSTAYITNVGDVESKGYELAGGWRNDNFRAGLAVAEARPKLNGYDLSDANAGLGVSTGRSWIMNLGYNIPAWNLDLAWYTRAVEEHQYTDMTRVQNTKAGYAVSDIYANWTPLGKDKVRVTFSVRNLFDKFYYDQGTYAYRDATGSTVYYGYAEPGRDVRLDLSWKF